MNATAREIVAALRLAPLPHEGGFFRATWRNTTGSAIYFLLTETDFSALHRLTHDEVWHFYAGDVVEHVQLDPCDGSLRVARMGSAVLAGDEPQVAVPAGVWQGARIAPASAADTAGDAACRRSGYALFGCTMSPPWDERGFELAARVGLTREFPAHAAWIAALTR
jgi:uncharacterized protein